MSLEERFHTRDLTYSIWHRPRSIGRFVGQSTAVTLGMIDLDGIIYLEYDNGTKEPIALIEYARDKKENKPASVMKRLAMRCVPKLPAFVVLYTPSTERNPADPNYQDISMFRVRRVCPEPETRFEYFSPKMWAEKLVSLRAHCERMAKPSHGAPRSEREADDAA